jgi:hypothetical protein
MKRLKQIIREQIDYGDYPERMDPNTTRRLGNPEQNLYGTNPAMPRGTLDVQRLASDRFKKVVDKLRTAINQPDLTPRYVQEMIMREYANAVANAKRIELQFNEELEELAIQSALKITETPEGRYNIDAKLTGEEVEGINPEKFQFTPKPKPQFGNQPDQQGGQDQEDRFDPNILTKDERFDLEIHKRNIINGIIQGASKKGHYIFQDPEIKSKIDEMNPNLYGYYLKLMAINDYFYFTMDNLIQALGETGQGIGGREDLTNNPPPEQQGGGEEGGDEEGDGENEDNGLQGHEVSEHNIKARALLFPILCHEVIKGIEEALGKFGYSNEPDIATAVIGQTDTLQNETMSLKIGPELVDRIRQNLPTEMFDELNIGIKPFFYKILYEIPSKSFLELIGKVVSNDLHDNTEASQKFKEIFQEAKSMRERYTHKRAQGNAPPVEPERVPQRNPMPEKPVENMDDKKLAGMGLNALNVEMNTAIDNENWELAQRIQKMIDRKQGVRESLNKMIKKHIS